MILIISTVCSKIIRAFAIILANFLWHYRQFLLSHLSYKQIKPKDCDLLNNYFYNCSKFEYFNTDYYNCSNTFDVNCRYLEHWVLYYTERGLSGPETKKKYGILYSYADRRFLCKSVEHCVLYYTGRRLSGSKTK